MLRKISLLSILLLIFTMVALGGQAAPSYAAAPTAEATDDFSVTMQLTGAIAAFSKQGLSLSNGTSVTINSQTSGPISALKIGQTVTIIAEVNDDELVAKSITLGVPTEDAIDASATPDGPGKSGKGKGKGEAPGGNGNDDSGKGNANGNANGKGN